MHQPRRDGLGEAERLVIAGRYCVEAELARGGMGTVYAVLDESTGQRVALKRLGSRGPGGATRRKGTLADAALLFELEYTRLARLCHPSIIEVHDYGVDASGPYYTMELLDGRDLLECGRVPYREACRLVRDIASSLALLHAHRLAHRDVSPRNVRLTAAGRAKLFDFGTLVPFGVPPDVAGTPAYVPPEAFHGVALDHRADLYGLGCLLYWLLTGTEARPAIRLDDLPRAFARLPPRPSTLAEDVPEELDALVLSLLSLDPLARPASAAELIERVVAIAKLDPEDLPGVMEGYFFSAKTVGRTAELSALGGAIQSALGSRGRGVLVEGSRGSGKSRLAREVARDAQLRGATVVFVEAGQAVGPNALLRAIGERLLLVSPVEAAEEAVRHAPHLVHLIPAVVSKVGSTGCADVPVAPGEGRARLSSAMRDWIVAFATRRPLVLVVDDVHRADEASAGVLASLSRSAKDSSLLVVATAETDGAPGAQSFGERVLLGPLDGRAVSELVRSLFGDAPHTRRWAHRLFDVSRGNPLHLMELMGHLVATRVVRYGNGAWTLPEEASPEAFPSSVEEAVRARLGRLGCDAIAVAEVLSIASSPLPLGLCLELARTEVGRSPSEAIGILDELVREGVVDVSGERYVLSDELLRQELHARLGPDRRERLHRRVAEALVSSERVSAFESILAGWHFLSGGDTNRGAALLADGGRRLIREAHDMGAAVPALEAALDICRRRGAKAHELVTLVGPLASAAFFVDRRLATRYGAEALALFREATGLARAEELRPTLGVKVALGVGVATAAMERRLSSDGVVVTTREMFELFLRCATTLSGVASVCLDADALRAVVAAVDPLSGLGEGHGAYWIHRFSSHLLDVCEGRFGKARKGLLDVLAELEGSSRRLSFPEQARRLFVGGALYALGAVESMRDGPEVLGYAQRLERLDLRLYDMVADQLRMLYHAHRGEADLARHHRERVEAHAVERGSAWQVEVWEQPVMLLVHVRENNVVGLKRVAERLGRLAPEIPSLAPYSLLAEAAYRKSLGEFEEAERLLQRVMDPALGVHAGIAQAVGVLAEVYNARGAHLRAEALTRRLLADTNPEEKPFARSTLLAQIQHAHALAGLGDVSAARRELLGAIEAHESGEGPVTLGLLHQAVARIALRARDVRTFARHLVLMEAWFRPTENPSLVYACERLRREGRADTTPLGGPWAFTKPDVVSRGVLEE